MFGQVRCLLINECVHVSGLRRSENVIDDYVIRDGSCWYVLGGIALTEIIFDIENQQFGNTTAERRTTKAKIRTFITKSHSDL